MSFGRIQRTQGQVPMSDINVTPMVDVMLVLLVIFIITAPFMASALRLSLPKAESSQANVSARTVRVQLNAQGQIFLDDKPVAWPDLAKALRDRANQAASMEDGELPEVQLQADADVAYGRVVEVIDVAQLAGLTRIGFVTEHKPAASKP